MNDALLMLTLCLMIPITGVSLWMTGVLQGRKAEREVWTRNARRADALIPVKKVIDKEFSVVDYEYYKVVSAEWYRNCGHGRSYNIHLGNEVLERWAGQEYHKHHGVGTGTETIG